MFVRTLQDEQHFDPKVHVENILGTIEGGDVTVACWEPGQTSPHPRHPDAPEIYFCFEGGGPLLTPDETVVGMPGGSIVPPRGGSPHALNGPVASAVLRVRPPP